MPTVSDERACTNDGSASSSWCNPSSDWPVEPSIEVNVPHSCTTIAFGSSVPWTGRWLFEVEVEQPPIIKNKAKLEVRIVAPSNCAHEERGPPTLGNESWQASFGV